ncbi:MAG TPA: YciI family protein, partial [Gammaproteobacteria bacterium]
MKFMMLHKTDAYYENGGLPSKELIAGVGAMVGEMVKSGKLLAADGLRSSAQGVRLEFSAGKRTVTKGPLVGENELVAGFAVMRVRSLDEAVEWASRFAGVVGDVVLDIRPATEPWDIGLGKKPDGLATRRYIAMRKASPRSEAGVAPTPLEMERMAALMSEMRNAGVLLSTGGLEPSSRAARLRNFGGKQTLVDGPFAESKELVGGFVILELDSRAEAIEWARRYA